jgi:MoxR-like ATPase
MATTTTNTGGLRLLRGLGIAGWNHLEPVILAALATEAPLLLIGPHGSAKTLVLSRLSEALGLAHRHYNASLLNFDDLVGFPVPESGKLVYLQTPATIWEAESVLFDEVSRCRPELQNKLFPIVHEKVVQGVALDRLRYRWGAMNPPPSADGTGDAADYAGADALDIALADRFGFIIVVPALADLARADQLAILGGLDTAPDTATRLRAGVAAVQLEVATVGCALRDSAAEYVQVVSTKLANAEHPISTRRAVQLTRNIVAVAAALRVQDPAVPFDDKVCEDAFYTALRHLLPDAAWGNPISQTTLLAVHRAAWQLARADQRQDMRAILLETDPVRRIALTLTSTLAGSEAGRVIVDAFSSLTPVARIGTAAVLGPIVARRKDLPAATVEPIASEFAGLAARHSERVTVRNGGADWRRQILSTYLAGLDRDTTRGKMLANAAIVLMQRDERFETDMLESAYDHAQSTLNACARKAGAA